METLTLQPIGEIPVFDDGYSLVSRAVANDGSLLFLYVEPDATNAVFERFKSGIGIFPKPRMEKAKRFRLVRVSQGEVRVIELPELNITFPVVDVFPDGSILLVATRAQWRAEGDYDLNAVVCDSGTNQAVHFLLGDGINSLGIDEQSRIWVAYSDEGVFGNFGWNNPGPETVGRSGLACFNRSGERIWEMPQHPEFFVDDCYALNVSGSGAHIYFYSDFPICRISPDFQLSFWKTELTGCHHFAISDREALFSFQYREPPQTAYLGTLLDGTLSNVRPVTLSLPDGSPIGVGEIIGRGPHIYFFDERQVFRWSLG